MKLTKEEQDMLAGKHGNAAKKSMEILVALGEIYGAENMIPVFSVQIAGVSYHNLGDAGLDYLEELSRDGKVRVLTTLNPAGMDLEDWRKLGISEDFAAKQLKVVDAFSKMGVIPSCTCTPYFVGNLPRFGEHIAWSESSAVCFANSVLGARTNREGGPSALAAALTGRTPNYGMHLDKNRQPQAIIKVKPKLKTVPDFGELGYAIGKKIGNKIPFITGVKSANTEQLKSFCASIATYGGTALFHIKGITPERVKKPAGEAVEINSGDLEAARAAMNDDCVPDFVSLGCPHASLNELRRIAELLKGKKVAVETWIAVARPVKELADKAGYSGAIEDAGAKLACDTCMVVAPLKGRFKCMATDSAKACFYARGTNNFKVRIGTVEQCIKAAVSGKWS
ncbi:MAG: aconitase X catalytic domain-containing protein [Candidatus Micrarchaeota archaeon]|nr:aconitase X catalytic domain-containing protein [Candidatus Micrarchaeota archaeon]